MNHKRHSLRAGALVFAAFSFASFTSFADTDNPQGTFELNIGSHEVESKLKELQKQIPDLVVLSTSNRVGTQFTQTLILGSSYKHWDIVFKVLPKGKNYSGKKLKEVAEAEFRDNSVPVKFVLKSSNGNKQTLTFLFERNVFQKIKSRKEMAENALASLRGSKNNNDINIAAREKGATLALAEHVEYNFSHIKIEKTSPKLQRKTKQKRTAKRKPGKHTKPTNPGNKRNGQSSRRAKR